MRVLHVAPSLETSWGGISHSVAGMVSALARHGVDVTVVATVPTFAPDVELVETDPSVDLRIFPQGRFSKFWTAYSRPLARFVASEIGRFDLVHVHSLWHYPGYVAYRQASKVDIPLVVSPSGSLATLALANDRLRKIIYSAVVQKRILNMSSLLHVLTRQEAEEARAYGTSTCFEVIPLGITLKPDSTEGAGAVWARSGRNGSKPFTVLFLGRVVRNKGLELLIETLAELKRRLHSVHLVVAGPYEEDYYHVLSSLAKQCGVTDSITFTGLVTGAQKSETFSTSDVFVLPSYTEGFSVAVLEAMAWRLPVILSHQCNFPEAAEAGAGFEVKPDVGQLAAAVERLIEEPTEATRMGRQARSLIEREYTWDAVVPRFIAAYEALVHSPLTRRRAAGDRNAV